MSAKVVWGIFVGVFIVAVTVTGLYLFAIDRENQLSVSSETDIVADSPRGATGLDVNRRDTQRKVHAARMSASFSEMLTEEKEVTYGCRGSIARASEQLGMQDPTTALPYKCVDTSPSRIGEYTIKGDTGDAVEHCLYLEAGEVYCRSLD